MQYWNKAVVRRPRKIKEEQAQKTWQSSILLLGKESERRARGPAFLSSDTCEALKYREQMQKILCKEEQSKNKGCRRDLASSKGATKGRTTNNQHRKGVLEMGISKGLPGTPERYRVMVGTEGVRAPVTPAPSGFWYRHREHHSASGHMS